MSKHSKKTNPFLKLLAIFIGDWNVEASSMSFRANQSEIARGFVTFKWVKHCFLIQHFEIPNSEFPMATAVIGPDDTNENYCMLYSDSRGVSRVYQMSLNGHVWKLWRTSPDFSQRFTGVFSDNENVITAKWENSTDGINWEHDFDLIYTKLNVGDF